MTGQQVIIPLAGPANRQGRIAADNIYGRNSVYRGTWGTAILRLFNLSAGCTGANEKALRKAGTHIKHCICIPIRMRDTSPEQNQLR